MITNILITLMSLISFSMTAQAVDSVDIVASLACNFENNLVKANLESKADGYELKINSNYVFFPSFQYKATSVTAHSKLFVFKGSPEKSGELLINVVILERNNPGKLCGAVQLIDSLGITVGGTIGCCTYIKNPSNEINFQIGQ